MNPNLERLSREIASKIEDDLLRVGIFHRIFMRPKSEESILNKLALKDYANDPDKKLLQDLIGVRIALYFDDDLPIVYSVLKKQANFVDETIDEFADTVFKPNRINLIFRMNEIQSKEAYDISIHKYSYVDTTYEIQLRTVLSEGWHEIEHDLRYKCKNDWNDHSDISHIFNGIYASLVTSDWSILSIFDNLAYRHYKSKKWSGMLRNKFRLRFNEDDLDYRVVNILNENNEIAKEIFKIDRSDFIENLFKDNLRIPVTLTNLIYVLNAYYLGNNQIFILAPEFIRSNKKLYPRSSL